MPSLYEILEIQDDATKEEIKAAYRKLVNRYHPDKNAGDRRHESKLKEAIHAYGILSDPTSRARYDSSRRTSRTNYKPPPRDESDPKNSHESNQRSRPQDSPKGNSTIKMNRNLSYGLLAALLLGVAVVFAWPRLQEYLKHKAWAEEVRQLHEAVGVSKAYKPQTATSLGIREATLETKWMQGSMYYILEFHGPEDQLDFQMQDGKLISAPVADTEAPREVFRTKMNAINTIILNFHDVDGYIVHTLRLATSSFTRILDVNNLPTSYRLNSNEVLDPHLYYRFNSWSFEYL